MKYTIHNNVAGKNILENANDTEFVLFVRQIAIENEDFDIMINNSLSAKEYIDEFCDNLEATVK